MLTKQLQHFQGGEGHQLLDDPEGAKGRAPSEGELQEGYAAPGDEALLPFGIAYYANWKVPADGISKHAREQVAALAATGLPVGLRSSAPGWLIADELHKDVLSVAYLENVSFSRTLIAIKHIIIQDPETLRRSICPSFGTLTREQEDLVYRSTIVYTSWERSTVHPEFVEILNRVGKVWVPCTANWTAFVESGVDESKVEVIGYPFDANSPIGQIAAPRGREEVPAGKRFYNIGKWEPRKNQHMLLGAFLTSFSPKDKASLLIKTSAFGIAWAGYPTPSESVQFWLEDPDVIDMGWDEKSLNRLVRIIFEKVSEADLIEIHRRNNIYVSAASGEAWDIPAFEAKVAGNRLVHIGYGGSEEYADTHNDVRVDSKMGNVHSGYLWEQDAQWAVTTVEKLGAAMKRAHPVSRRVLSPNLVQICGRAQVGREMYDSIVDLAKKLGCAKELLGTGGFG